MTFNVQDCLTKATGRAKSDVANKLISMLLHETSREICNRFGLSVGDRDYVNAVVDFLGKECCYCSAQLERDRVVVEHPDGLNRFRAGLHVPGNALLACRKCNNEKRRDDQMENLLLAETGWESFLSHDSSQCASSCKTCTYWAQKFPDFETRRTHLQATKKKISEFRFMYPDFMETSQILKPALLNRLNSLYRECQEFAAQRIKISAASLFEEVNWKNYKKQSESKA
jgi:hypothetical protein